MFLAQSARRRLLGGGGGFSPYKSFYTTGNGTVTVPSGAAQLVVRVQGAGGGAAKANYANPQCGGGGGGYALKTIALDPADIGKVLAWSVGLRGAGKSGTIGAGSPGGSSTVDIDPLVAGTGLVVGGGGGGGSYIYIDNPYGGSGGYVFLRGVGGTATGGDDNNPGGFGGAGGGLSGSGAQGGGVPGRTGSNYGGGGGSGQTVTPNTNGGTGGLGFVEFSWS